MLWTRRHFMCCLTSGKCGWLTRLAFLRRRCQNIAHQSGTRRTVASRQIFENMQQSVALTKTSSMFDCFSMIDLLICLFWINLTFPAASTDICLGGRHVAE